MASNPSPPNSPGYVLGHDAATLREQQTRTLHNSSAFLKPHLHAATHLLDVGCGPASITASLAEHMPHGRVVGVDRDAAVIAAARRSFPALELHVGDMAGLPFADASFDVVLAHMVLMYVPHVSSVLAELARVCRPGGRIAVRERWAGSFIFSPDLPGLRVFERLFAAGIDAAGGDARLSTRLPGLLRAAGFAHVQVSADVECVSAPQERAVRAAEWIVAVRDGALAHNWKKMGLATDDEVREVIGALEEFKDAPDAFWMQTSIETIAVKLE